MRKVLFVIGLTLFFGGLSFAVFTFKGCIFDGDTITLDDSKIVVLSIILTSFCVGAYLLNTNRWEDEK